MFKDTYLRRALRGARLLDRFTPAWRRELRAHTILNCTHDGGVIKHVREYVTELFPDLTPGHLMWLVEHGFATSLTSREREKLEAAWRGIINGRLY